MITIALPRIRLAKAFLGLTLSIASVTSPAAGPPAVTTEEAMAATRQAHEALREGRYAELEAELGALQAAYEADTNQEYVLDRSLRRFQVADPELGPALDRWLAAHPQSYPARIARALHNYQMARIWRGRAYINATHPARIELMEDYLKRASKDLEAAVPLTAKPVLAYEIMIGMARYVGAGGAARELLDRAAKTDPQATGPYEAFVILLLPRWGGSHEAMQALARDAEKDDHPKMKWLAAYIRSVVAADKADSLRSDGDLAGAMRGYQDAVLASRDYTWAQCALANVYRTLGQTDNALAAAQGALARNGNNIDCLEERANAHNLMRHETEMLDDLRNAALLGSVDSARRLGFLLTEGGNNVKRDVAEGLHWLERAAYFWNATALFELGLIYERGMGVPANHARSVEYYRACANLKNLQCENNLAMMLWYGKGVAADHEEAARLWIRVHKQGDWHGRHNLEFFFSPMERVKLAATYGPGMWALKPLATIGLLILGAILIAWILIRRPFAARTKRL